MSVLVDVFAKIFSASRTMFSLAKRSVGALESRKVAMVPDGMTRRVVDSGGAFAG